MMSASIGSNMTAGMTPGTPDIKSGGPMAFGPEGILFMGDTQGAAVFAIDLNDRVKDTVSKPVDIIGIDKKLAAMLGMTPDGILINDLAVNPISQNIYLSVSRRTGHLGFDPIPIYQVSRLVAADSAPVLIKVTKKGTIEEVPLTKVMFSKAMLSNPFKPDAEIESLWGEAQWQLTITHLAYVDGQLLVAGLSNEEFSSTLRRLPFPFKQGQGGEEVTGLEVFHTAHERYETRAPIDTFLPFHVKGKPVLLAAYGCSPLAVFPLDELKQKKQMRGTTIAELGSGNQPIDMISFKRDGKEYILISNTNRAMMRISAEDIDRAESITTPVKESNQTVGVKYAPIAGTGVLQLDTLNDRFVVLINRDLQTGALNLRSVPMDHF
jgi:hypothetical protein